MTSQTSRKADSAEQSYLVATIGSSTERGGIVVSSDSSPEGVYIDEHKIACVDDVVRYPDGTESRIVSGAGDGHTISGRPVALVGSHIANGDSIVSSLQTVEEFTISATEEPPRGFLQPGFKPADVPHCA